jgi:hypothetical protein
MLRDESLEAVLSLPAAAAFRNGGREMPLEKDGPVEYI